MADFIHLFLSIPTRVKPVWHVNDHRVLISNVSVCVNYPRRNGDKGWIFASDVQNLVLFWLSFAVFPKVKFVGAVKKQKAVGLVVVLVRAAGNAGLRNAQIAHRRGKTFWQAIDAEKFNEPTPRILVSRDRFHDYTFHHCGGKRVPLG